MRTHNIPFSIKKIRLTLNYAKSGSQVIFPRDLRICSKQLW